MSARLSPAASLLRNSKLFALPPAIALPATPPSADQVSSSDTATTVYPRYAAIETTTISGSQGDWGFKRPLPLKSTKATSNPVVRLVRGIDTPEHIADFESAADHALTLRKFQELNMPLHLQRKDIQGGYKSQTALIHDSVFNAASDNILPKSSRATSTDSAHETGIWPEINSQQIFDQLPPRIQRVAAQVQEQERAAKADKYDLSGANALESVSRGRTHASYSRWRFSGPSLVQLTGMEFEDYIHSLGQKEKDMLVGRIKRTILQDKLHEARREGNMEGDITEQAITDKEVQNELRRLRNDPTKFGPILAEMLDLPEGPVAGSKNTNNGAWDYGSRDLATEAWRTKGPPRTHPSAGLSYLRSAAFASNDPVNGPQSASTPVVARAVKTKNRAGSGGGNDVDYGVAGFIVPPPRAESSRAAESFTPQPGGMKIVVRPVEASITEDGVLKLATARATGYKIENDKPVDEYEAESNYMRDLKRQQAASAPQLSGGNNGYTPRAPRRATARQEAAQESQEETDLQRIMNMRPSRNV